MKSPLLLLVTLFNPPPIYVYTITIFPIDKVNTDFGKFVFIKIHENLVVGKNYIATLCYRPYLPYIYPRVLPPI